MNIHSVKREQMLVTPVPNSQFSHRRKKKKKQEGFWLILVYFQSSNIVTHVADLPCPKIRKHRLYLPLVLKKSK